MDKIDKNIKNLLDKVHRSDPDINSQKCPGHDMLATYVDGTIDRNDIKAVENHIVECDSCLDLIILHNKILKDEAHLQSPEAPVKWIAHAKQLFPASRHESREGLIDIVLIFSRETINILRNAGDLSVIYDSVPVPVRGEQETLSSNHITLSKAFSDIETVLDVEKTGKGHINIKVTSTETGTNAPARDLRISLFNPKREIASYFAKDGTALFEDLLYGEYVIKITRLSNKADQISLSIRE